MIDDGSPSTTSSGDDFTIGDVLAENHLLREERAELIAQLKLATLREQASLQRLRTDESKRTELESQLKDLQERLCEQSNEILSILPLRLKLNEVRQRADTLKVDLQCAEGSISDLTRKLQRKETAWEKLQVELLEARCEIDTLALKVRELSAEKKALQAAGLKKGTIIASLSADVESLRAEIEKSEEQKFELLADRSHWEKKALTLSKVKRNSLASTKNILVPHSLTSVCYVTTNSLTNFLCDLPNKHGRSWLVSQAEPRVRSN